MRLRLLLVIGVLAVGAMVDTGAAEAKLDPSFGVHGIVEVRPPLPPPSQNQYVRHMVGARDGDSFVLIERQQCFQGNCTSHFSLLRYLSSGALDPTFGGPSGYYDLPQDGEGIPALAVDSSGRPLVAQVGPSSVVIRRFTSSGTPDPSFGAGGVVSLGCACGHGWARLAPGPDGSVTAILPDFSSREGRGGTIFTLARLTASGARDPKFAGGSDATISLQGAAEPTSTFTTPSGALYMSGPLCCTVPNPGYVVRVSAKGRLDWRFTTASQRSLRRLSRLPALQPSINAVLVRSGGKIDLLGAAGYTKGFVLRLNPNGHLRSQFAKKGLRTLSLPVGSASFGSEGTELVTSWETRGANVLAGILPGGRMDPSFGPSGEEVPGAAGDFGLTVAAQAGRKALVLDLGNKACRGFCPSEPKLVRFLEGPKRH